MTSVKENRANKITSPRLPSSVTPRSSQFGSCEKRTVPRQRGWWPVVGGQWLGLARSGRFQASKGLRFAMTPHPPASVLRTGRAGYAWNRLRRGTSAAAGWPWRVRYQRKCRLVSAKLVRLLRADPLDATSAVADSTAIRADAPAVGVFARRGALPCSRQGARIRADAPVVSVFASQAECISETPVYRSGQGIWRYSLPRGN
jgi:hypothetical protein